mmetsp:Transcript_18850/g.39215  ORF Transcript_18850/g.39215 Transcript_18850/m.39215 type:complete len:92 (-) Transcript_18850:154-429(-)
MRSPLGININDKLFMIDQQPLLFFFHLDQILDPADAAAVDDVLNERLNDIFVEGWSFLDECMAQGGHGSGYLIGCGGRDKFNVEGSEFGYR